MIKNLLQGILAFLAVVFYSCFSLLGGAEIDWTRFKGTVKAINLKTPAVTIQNSDGDLFTVPIDYQVKIVDKKNVLRRVQDVEIDSKITLLRVIQRSPSKKQKV